MKSFRSSAMIPQAPPYCRTPASRLKPRFIFPVDDLTFRSVPCAHTFFLSKESTQVPNRDLCSRLVALSVELVPGSVLVSRQATVFLSLGPGYPCLDFRYAIIRRKVRLHALCAFCCWRDGSLRISSHCALKPSSSLSG